MKPRAGGHPDDPKQPLMREHEDYTLTVSRTERNGVRPPAASLPLQVFYTPRALAWMMPRLVAEGRPKTYLFSMYVEDTREVMLRYLDVGTPRVVTITGRPLRAIPVSDRLGLMGSVTTHYVSPTGEYLGSENKDSGITTVASNKDELMKIWHGQADPKQPGAIEEPDDHPSGGRSALIPPPIESGKQ
jgi:hypothetical protein